MHLHSNRVHDWSPSPPPTKIVRGINNDCSALILGLNGFYSPPPLLSKSGLKLVCNTGRQPPPLYSVLYRIISMRRCVLPKLLLREKSGSYKVDTDNNIPSLSGGSMNFIWWKLKMSYHTAYPSWECPVVHLFLYSFIYLPTTAFTWLSKFCTSQLSSVSWDLSWCMVSFLKGDLQFTKLFKNTICTGVCTLKCTEKCFIPFTPLNFLP